MKELLALLSLLASGLAQAEAPYPASGWKPSGPAFELPQRQPQNTQYLPPVDPRNPVLVPEESDVSVQGLPVLEQQPIFQISPVNGQQYVGPAFNADIQALEERSRQNQLQVQQEIAREFARQRALDAAQSNNNANRVLNPQPPRQFGQTTTKTTANTYTTPKYNQPTTTELSLNQRETLNEKEDENKGKVDVEITKQKIQEFPAELFLSPLTQQFQSKLIPLEQFAQLSAPLYFQQIQDAKTNNDQAILAASILNQRQILGQSGQIVPQTPLYLQPADQAADPALVQTFDPQGFGRNPLNQAPVVAQPQAVFNQPQPVFNRPQPAFNQFNQPGFSQFAQQPNYQFQSQIPLNSQYEPIAQAQVADVDKESDQADKADDDDKLNKDQPQFVYQQVYQQPQQVYQQPQQVYQQPQQVYQQPQPVYQQPQQVYQQPQQVYQQPQQVYQQPQQVYQEPRQVYQQPQQVYQQQPQEVFQQAQQVYQEPQQIYQQQQQFYQQQINQQPQTNQDQFLFSQAQYGNPDLNQFYQIRQSQVQAAQDALQSNLNVNQQGNDLDENDNEDQNIDTNGAAVATATVFGTRTQPRTFVRYGAPAPSPTAQDTPQTTTESSTEAITEGPVIAEATAVANGRRKSAKLRNRRVRPVFTVDRSGHLILAQEQ